VVRQPWMTSCAKSSGILSRDSSTATRCRARVRAAPQNRASSPRARRARRPRRRRDGRSRLVAGARHLRELPELLVERHAGEERVQRRGRRHRAARRDGRSLGPHGSSHGRRGRPSRAAGGQGDHRGDQPQGGRRDACAEDCPDGGEVVWHAST
jgi:hypothetical protein